MIVIRRADLEMAEECHDSDEAAAWRSALPCEPTHPGFSGHQLEHLAPIYFEIDEGCRLGEHVDSAEEIVLLLEGEVEVTVGGETGQLGPGDMAVIPADTPHAIRNVGTGTARCFGVFASRRVSHLFTEPIMPYGIKDVDPVTLEQQR